jgi:SAM-dependent methyltransferase
VVAGQRRALRGGAERARPALTRDQEDTEYVAAEIRLRSGRRSWQGAMTRRAELSEADRSAMDAEFDVFATWTLEAVQRLGPDHAIPAGCRGSASPGALAWLGEACELTPGSSLVDVGSGVGGPAAFAAERFGVRPILIEPRLGACRAAHTLFGMPSLAGAGDRLPLPSGSVDAAWCLGVICTTTQKADVIGELRRVLRPGASLGLLVFVGPHPHPAGSPDGNEFPTTTTVLELLAEAGFDVLEQVDADDFAAPPLSWTERADRVHHAIEQAHGSDPLFAVAQDQQHRIGRLLASGQVTGRLLHATAAS